MQTGFQKMLLAREKIWPRRFSAIVSRRAETIVLVYPLRFRMKNSAPVFGVIFANRDFFPDKLVEEARADYVKLFAEMGIEGIMLDPTDTKLGGVETYGEARKCADLLKRNADRIWGIIVALPNFGDEKGVADTIKLSGLRVPILVQGYPDDLDRLDVVRRRDAFCGKISVC